ncbi:hypothetical protein HY990_06780 [Candidatus Micrarchaeota archaeon]|nr:hypothetical protein [Candidatus Micrarchaeota archaeon]
MAKITSKFVLILIVTVLLFGCLGIEQTNEKITSNTSKTQDRIKIEQPTDISQPTDTKENQTLSQSENGCRFNNPACADGQVCNSNNQCVDQVNFDHFCPMDQRVSRGLDTDSITEMATIFSGNCIIYDTGTNQYAIKFNGLLDTNGEFYDLVIYDQNSNDYSVHTLYGKNVRLGSDLTISMTYTAQEPRHLKLFLHRTRAIDQMDIIGNCGDYTSAQNCNQFLLNTRRYTDAMERVSGISIGECYDQLRYSFVSDITNGHTSAYGEITTITAGTFAQGLFNTQNYEGHEPIHAMYFCANMPLEDNMNHAFWFATEEQIARSYGDVAAADEALRNNQHWMDQIAQNPSILDGGSVSGIRGGADNSDTMMNGCHGAQSYIFNRKYLASSATQRTALVRTLFQRIKNDRALLRPNAMNEVNRIVCDVTSDPECAEFLRARCL